MIVHREQIYTEASNETPAYSISLDLELGRPLTDDDKSIIYKFASDLKEALLRNSILLDPIKKEESEKEVAELLTAFPPDTLVYVEKIPYGYCPRYCCAHRHWLIVTTPIGRIKIGNRKSVINIDWADTTIAKYAKTLPRYIMSTMTPLPRIHEILFPDYKHTIDETYIHTYDIVHARWVINSLLNFGKTI